jgi:hypothetical protein
MSKVRTKKQDSKKVFVNLIRLQVLEDEIAYAQSQLQPHDTGHIYTAISWLQHRVRKLKGQNDD